MLYDKFGRYYDLMYSSVDYEKEIGEIYNLFQSQNPLIKSVLDVGYGTGAYVLGLLKKGYLVDGIDSSPSMVEAARVKLKEARVHSNIILEDINKYSFEKTYDAAICLFGSFDYLYQNHMVLKLIERINKCLTLERSK